MPQGGTPKPVRLCDGRSTGFRDECHPGRGRGRHHGGLLYSASFTPPPTAAGDADAVHRQATRSTTACSDRCPRRSRPSPARCRRPAAPPPPLVRSPQRLQHPVNHETPPRRVRERAAPAAPRLPRPRSPRTATHRKRHGTRPAVPQPARSRMRRPAGATRSRRRGLPVCESRACVRRIPQNGCYLIGWSGWVRRCESAPGGAPERVGPGVRFVGRVGVAVSECQGHARTECVHPAVDCDGYVRVR
ncbi:hypothetical protein ACVWXB_000088 [Streptomyces sp. TE12347]